MHAARWLTLGSLALTLACPSDDDDDGADTQTSDPSSSTTAPSESSSGPAESSTGAESSSGAAESSSGAAESSSGALCPIDAECQDDAQCPGGGMCLDCICIGGNQCDPIVVGEWNACVGKDGNTDNTLCNYMGTGGSNGFIGCLSSSSVEGSNVCFISDCVDACDCFAPPATGTAEPVCAAILEGGGMGCALDCSAGKTCPDGMECQTDICFWPAAK